MNHDRQPWSRGDGASFLSRSRLPGAVAAPHFPATVEPLLLTLREVERQHIERVLAMTGSRRAHAAKILGITRWSLSRRIRRFGLQPR